MDKLLLIAQFHRGHFQWMKTDARGAILGITSNSLPAHWPALLEEEIYPPQHGNSMEWHHVNVAGFNHHFLIKHVETQTESSSWHNLLLFCCHCLTLQQLTPSAFPAWLTVPSPPPLPKAAFPFLTPQSLCRKGSKKGSQITNWTQSTQKHSFLQHQHPLFSHVVPWEQRSASGKKVPAQFEQSNICSAWLLEQLLYVTYLYWWLCC